MVKVEKLKEEIFFIHLGIGIKNKKGKIFCVTPSPSSDRFLKYRSKK